MRQTGADSPAPSQTVHWTVCVPLWRERAVRIPSLREKQKALSPDGERAFCGASGDTAFFKKHSNINGFRTPEQRNYLYSALLKQSISAAIARFISR